MFATYQRLHVLVSASNREVIKAASKKLKPAARTSREYREGRHLFYRNMLEYHAQARNLVKEWKL
jgi:hypothetical protein